MARPSVTTTERTDFLDVRLAAKLGALLPKDSAKALEKVLKVNPGDILTRARLLGHYWRHYQTPDASAYAPATSELRTAHILWFIKNAADSLFAGDRYLSCDSAEDEKIFNSVKSAWIAQIKTKPTSAQIRINYALFVLDRDPVSARNALLEVLETEPLNEWALALLPKVGHKCSVSLPLPVDVSATVPPHVAPRLPLWWQQRLRAYYSAHLEAHQSVRSISL